MMLDLNDLLAFAIAFLASIGLAEVVGAVWRRFKPEPPPKKSTWTVSFTTPDGFPMTGYSMDSESAKRVMCLAQFEYENKFR